MAELRTGDLATMIELSGGPCLEEGFVPRPAPWWVTAGARRAGVLLTSPAPDDVPSTVPSGPPRPLRLPPTIQGRPPVQEPAPDEDVWAEISAGVRATTARIHARQEARDGLG